MAIAIPAAISAASMASNITQTPPSKLTRGRMLSIHAVWTGSPVGSFVIEGSNNYDESQQTGNWEDMTSLASPTIPAVSGAGSMMVHLTDMTCIYIRVRYVFSSGTGTLNVWATAKPEL